MADKKYNITVWNGVLYVEGLPMPKHYTALQKGFLLDALGYTEKEIRL